VQTRSSSVALYAWAGIPLFFSMLFVPTTYKIANATNPYLLKFDFMWVIFLPLAVINRILLDASKRQAS
jgi:hypothetical protein